MNSRITRLKAFFMHVAMHVKRPVICGMAGMLITLGLLLFGFILSMVNTQPFDPVPTKGVRLATLPEVQEQTLPTESNAVEAPTVPQIPTPKDMIMEVQTPPLDVQYVLNPQVAVGVSVPAVPSFSAPNLSQAAFSAGELDDSPKTIYAPLPQYPAKAKRVGKEGEVMVRLVVDREGRVIKVTLLSATDANGFSEAAVQAVKKWRFQPGKRAGAAVLFEVDVPVKFTLGKR